jgi:hypothetical protein
LDNCKTILDDDDGDLAPLPLKSPHTTPQRVKGEIATRWDKGIGQMFNGSSSGVAAGFRRQQHLKDGIEEYSGSRTLRMLHFWSRAIAIYNDYKLSQVREE